MEKITLNVYTKRMPNGKWSCFTTYKGIDRAYVGDTISVVADMGEWLVGKPVNPVWHDPVIHPLREKEPEIPIRYQRSRIDFL